MIVSLASFLLLETPHAKEEGCSIGISLLPPDARGGRAYRLVYDVPVSINSMWQFKTSFDSTIPERNRYIAYHRLINREDNVVVTENRYSLGSGALFRWQTRVFPNRRRLEFKLINSGNAGRHGHRFHYGHIQLTALDRATRVTQVAYFDFWGAGFWAMYPWSGGMQNFLEYTASWECKEAVHFEKRLALSDGRSRLKSEQGGSAPIEPAPTDVRIENE